MMPQAEEHLNVNPPRFRHGIALAEQLQRPPQPRQRSKNEQREGEENAERGMRSAESNPQLPALNTQPSTLNTQAKAEAEACFLKAIEIARQQQAKSLELRAVMSLSRLWQQYGKKKEAHQMLAD
ncbi:MAG: hypothetical protein ACRD6I_19835, partial [Candidatus Acidiferrales bacterium]